MSTEELSIEEYLWSSSPLHLQILRTGPVAARNWPFDRTIRHPTRKGWSHSTGYLDGRAKQTEERRPTSSRDRAAAGTAGAPSQREALAFYELCTYV